MSGKQDSLAHFNKQNRAKMRLDLWLQPYSESGQSSLNV